MDSWPPHENFSFMPWAPTESSSGSEVDPGALGSSGLRSVPISLPLLPWWDFYLEAWGRDLFERKPDRLQDSRPRPPRCTTTTINLHKFTVYKQDSKPVMSRRRSGRSQREMRFAHLLRPSPGKLLINLRGGCTVRDWSGAVVERLMSKPVITFNIVFPDCNHVPVLSLTSSEAQRSLWFLLPLLYKLSDAPSPSDFLLPFQFILFNSTRLLGSFNATLMR